MIVSAFQPFYKIYKETDITSSGWYTSSAYFLPTRTIGDIIGGGFPIEEPLDGGGYWGFITGSWLSYPANAPLPFLGQPIPYYFPYSTTRTGLYVSGGMALAWGSAICDLLWNATALSWSVEIQPGGAKYDQYTVFYNSTSSFFGQASPGPDSDNGYGEVIWPIGNINKYNITSSWHAVDYRLLQTIVSTSAAAPNQSRLAQMTAAGSPQRVSHSIYLGYGVTVTTTQSFFDNPPGSGGEKSVSSSVGYTLDYSGSNTIRNTGFDNQFFDVGQGVGITRADISQSLTTMSWDGYGPLGVSVTEDPNKPGTYNGNTLKGILTQSIALKKRRLFYPTPVTGTPGEVNGTDYYHKRITGYTANEIFNENGGIYNIQFTLKKYAPTIPTTSTIPFNYSPSDNSFLAVFIHNVQSIVPLSSSRELGDSGWYPPLNNIVIIGNNYDTAPQIAFSDGATNFTYEKYNINLIQYGYPAQLCFEACGDWATGAAFGIIISDVKICKIGVSTDPRFIKPISVLTNFDDKIIISR
jgi:hypothetical protein